MTYLLIGLFVYGLHQVIWNVADFFGVDLDDFYHYYGPEYNRSERPLWQKFIMKPLFYCPLCMSSLWGSVCFFLILNGRDLQLWILHCVVCAAIVYILTEIIEWFKRN